MPSGIYFLPDQGSLVFGGGGTEYMCQLVVGMVTSEQPENVVESMCEAVITPGRERLYLDLDYFQDWHATGISTYFWNNAGNVVTFNFVPQIDGKPGMGGSCRLRRPAAFGGPARQPARDRIRHPIVGVPTLAVDV